MSFILNDNTGVKRELLEPDNYVARCYGIIITGTEFDQRFGKAQTKLIILWELPTVIIDVNRDGETLKLPKGQSATYTMSMNEKANLRKTLESWRGKGFTAEELAAGFDISRIVGTPCLLNIIQQEGPNGNTYNKITNVSKLPSGFTCPKQVNPTILFDITDPEQDLSVMDRIPAWIQERIRKSDEYQRRLYPDEEIEAIIPGDDEDLEF